MHLSNGKVLVVRVKTSKPTISSLVVEFIAKLLVVKSIKIAFILVIIINIKVDKIAASFLVD